jgi:hypothetical protein
MLRNCIAELLTTQIKLEGMQLCIGHSVSVSLTAFMNVMASDTM